MFKHINSETALPNFLVVHMSQLCNSIIKTAKSLFKEISDDSYVIYSPRDKENPLMLGYFILDKLPITTSKQYPYLLNNTLSQGGEDKTEEFRNLQTIHIAEWLFDESLKNKTALDQIFELITLGGIIQNPQSRTLLWTDYSTFLFYPFDKMDRNRAIAYFVEGFCYL